MEKSLLFTMNNSFLLREGIGKVITAGVNGDTYPISVGNGSKPTGNDFEEFTLDKTLDIIIINNRHKYEWVKGLRNKHEIKYMAVYQAAVDIIKEYNWKMQGGNIYVSAYSGSQAVTAFRCV